jgi:hypothetical protein
MTSPWAGVFSEWTPHDHRIAARRLLPRNLGDWFAHSNPWETRPDANVTRMIRIRSLPPCLDGGSSAHRSGISPPRKRNVAPLASLLVRPQAVMRVSILWRPRLFMSGLRAWSYAAATDSSAGHDLRLELLRGFAVFAMVADHIGGETSWLYAVTGSDRFSCRRPRSSSSCLASSATRSVASPNHCDYPVWSDDLNGRFSGWR